MLFRILGYRKQRAEVNDDFGMMIADLTSGRIAAMYC